MYIVDQDRSNVVNIGNIKSIALNGKRITADDYTLAAYELQHIRGCRKGPSNGS